MVFGLELNFYSRTSIGPVKYWVHTVTGPYQSSVDTGTYRECALFRHLENIFLALDEICDQGIVMEIDPQAVFDRLAIRGEDIPLSEQNITQLYQQAKEQVKWSLFK